MYSGMLNFPKYLKGVGQLNFTSIDRVPGLTGGFSNHHNHSAQTLTLISIKTVGSSGMSGVGSS